MTTVASLLRERVGDARPGYIFEDRVWSWAAVAEMSSGYAAWITRTLDDARPAHVGVLLDNVPEYLFLAGGASFAHATLVGINPTRRGEELVRDIRHTDCQIIVTDSRHATLLDGMEIGVPIIDIASLRIEPLAVPPAESDPPNSLPHFLLFTSGSTAAPKAVVCSMERMAMAGVRTSQVYGVTADDVCYCVMPLFHGNALMACWAPALAQGATIVLRRKFSASGWLDDVRRHGITYFTYVGRTIAYVLAQPTSAFDGDHRLRLGFGTEASALDRERFAERFGCELVEGYGSSESVVIIHRTPDTPLQALGRPRPDMAESVRVVDPATSDECPRAVFDEHGAVTNPECVGELVNTVVPSGAFEGYYNNPSADADRLRDGWYWTGDLAYRDAEGFFYFAGRSADWLRVDSENFAAAPVENILARFPGVVMAAVYAVPDPQTGDMVMAALELQPGVEFDPLAFDEFLAERRDLGTKWAPQLVRLVTDMPLTANNKINKRPLRANPLETTDPLWIRSHRGGPLQRRSRSDEAHNEAHNEARTGR